MWSTDEAPPSHSVPAAIAAKAAARQGADAFARYHRALMENYFHQNRNITEPENLVRIAGETSLDVTAFLEQAREYDAQGDVRDSVLKLLSLQGQRHPFAVLRAAELRKWVDDGAYQAILAGDYPRRGGEDEASISDEAREAARSYRQTVDESADALLRVLRAIGEEAASVGQRVADRVRRESPSDPP